MLRGQSKPRNNTPAPQEQLAYLCLSHGENKRKCFAVKGKVNCPQPLTASTVTTRCHIPNISVSVSPVERQITKIKGDEIMKTAVIYARYSSDSQTEQSIEGQMRICEEYAKKNNIVILDKYIDRAMTGTNDNRPDFQRMIKDSARREWNYVLVYKLDRFSRNKYETAIHKKTLRDNGVKVLSAMENIPDTPEGIILESLLEGYAEYYSAELSQKVKRGMKETRLKGNFTGGTIIYGYKVENHKVTVDEEKAEVVRYIYERYAMGVYVKDIISALTEKGIFNKGKPFARNTIYNILKNEKYFGICRHNDEVFDNIYPAIVPKDVYEKVRRKTDANKYGKRSVEVVYMLRNKMICGYCGKPISAETGTSKGGKKIRYYKCLGRKHNNGCTKSMVRKELLEDFVVSNIVKLLSEKEVKDKMISSLMRMQEELITDNADLQRLTKERKTTETQITNIMTAIENGGTSATAMKRLRELELKAAELEKAIAIQKAKTADRYTEEEMRAYYEQALSLEPQMLINTLVKQITLYDDKIIIQYNSPIKAGPDESRDFSFYEKQLKMPYVRQNKKDLQYRKFTIVLSV